MCKNEVNEPVFYYSDCNLYQFNNKWNDKFIKYTEFLLKRDRMAWNIGTIIKLKQKSYKFRKNNIKWKLCKIINIDYINNKLIIQYFKGKNRIKKRINIYSYNNIKSTIPFIETRKNLKIGSLLQVKCINKWYQGIITNITFDKYNNYIEWLTIEYFINNINNTNNTNTQQKQIIYTDRWSPNIRI